jgi:hypothetical protein
MAKSTNGGRICDICHAEGKETPSVYDAQLRNGPWADVCETHFQALALGVKGTFTTLANIGKPGRARYSD